MSVYRSKLVSAWALLFAGLSVSNVRAELYGFTGLSNNNVADVLAGEAQLSVEVTDAGSGRALFTFRNVGSAAMSITDIYFDNGTALASLHSISNSPGVQFSNGASPPNLPAGSTAIPPFVADFGMDSDPPVAGNGVNPGEWLGITFNLSGDFSGLISELNSAATRIGIHVQSFASGGSETFLNTSVVPVPGPLALAAVGLLLIAPLKRRMR